MKILLKLKNKENEFIGAAFCLIYEGTKAGIEECFESSIIEYNWPEDSSLENGIAVLFNAIFNIKKVFGGLVYVNKNDTSKKAERYVKRNLYRTSDFLDDASIFLEERWLSSAESFADEIIEMVEPTNTIY